MTNRERKQHVHAPGLDDQNGTDNTRWRRRSEEPDAPSVEETLRARNVRIRSWVNRFATAVRLEKRLTLLIEFGLTDRDIAKAVPRANPRSIRRWRTQGAPASRIDERWEPVDDLCTIVGYLASDGSYDEAAIVAWLRSRQPLLEGERPLDVVGVDFDAVRRAAQRLLELTHAQEDELAEPAAGVRSRASIRQCT